MSKQLFHGDLYAIEHHFGELGERFFDVSLTALQCRKVSEHNGFPLLEVIKDQEQNGGYLVITVHGRLKHGNQNVLVRAAHEVVLERHYMPGGTPNIFYRPVDILQHGTYCTCGADSFHPLYLVA